MCRLVLCCWLLILAAFGKTAESAERVLVVCPAGWESAARDWKQFRQNQGYEIRVAAKADAIALDQPDYLLLVGTHQLLPARLVAAKINCRWGSEPQIATDYAMVDPDGDGLSETVVARIPAPTAAAAERYFKKVILAERQPAPLSDEHHLSVVASPGRFSPLLDRMIEATAVRLLGESTPAACPLDMIYADWRSSYCPDPLLYTKRVAQSLSRAGYWIYLGHGLHDRLDPFRTPQGIARTLDAKVIEQLNNQAADAAPARVAAIIACYAGAVDSHCLAEQLIASPAGPLSVIAGSRVTMPYGNAKLGAMLLDELFEQTTPTVGRVLHNAKQRMVGPVANGTALNELDTMLDLMASSYAPNREDRRQERIEHAQMYHLFGDPLLAVHRPKQMACSAHYEPVSSHLLKLTVAGVSPQSGTLEVALVKPRDHAMRLPRRKEFSITAEERDAYQSQWKHANERRVWSISVAVDAGAFSIEREVPSDSPTQLIARLRPTDPSQSLVTSATNVTPAVEPVQEVASKPDTALNR